MEHTVQKKLGKLLFFYVLGLFSFSGDGQFFFVFFFYIKLTKFSQA